MKRRHLTRFQAGIKFTIRKNAAPFADTGESDWGKEIRMADIIDTIRGNTSLSKLLSLLEKANLIDTLKGPGPFTLFAPTNESFTRMNIEDILKDPKELSDTLSYHIAAGKHTAEAIAAMETLDTEYGKALTVVIEEGETMVDNAKFVTTNIECSNGIIHIVDNVFKTMLSGWYREE
jgi:uncharacterized surface protein with fasciclin (FAS1) repeats